MVDGRRGATDTLTFDEGRDGAWNLGSPPRARLAAPLCARAGAARSSCRVRGGAPRSSAEDEEDKAADDSISRLLAYYHAATAVGRAKTPARLSCWSRSGEWSGGGLLVFLRISVGVAEREFCSLGCKQPGPFGPVAEEMGATYFAALPAEMIFRPTTRITYC